MEFFSSWSTISNCGVATSSSGSEIPRNNSRLSRLLVDVKLAASVSGSESRTLSDSVASSTQLWPDSSVVSVEFDSPSHCGG